MFLRNLLLKRGFMSQLKKGEGKCLCVCFKRAPEEGGELKKIRKRNVGKSAGLQQNIKRCGSAVNELTIKPQDEKESQLF